MSAPPPQPPPGASGQYGQTKVVVQAGMMPMAGLMIVGPNPVPFVCPNCGFQGTTEVNRHCGATSWIVCIALSCIGCLPCGLFALCCPACMDSAHTCPQCNTMIGIYKRI